MLRRREVLALTAMGLPPGGALAASGAPSRPRPAELVVNAPTPEALREMLSDPAGWAEARRHVAALLLADGAIRDLPDATLATLMARLREWGLRLELEVGAIKEWSTEGEHTLALEAPQWARVAALPPGLSAVAMDEPLGATRLVLHRDDAYAAEQTARFVAGARRRFPGLRVGDVEPFPGIARADHARWLDALTARLAALGERPLDFYRLDVDWNAFAATGTGWGDVLSVQWDCAARGLPFSLIYWAADLPALRAQGRADGHTWHDGILREGIAYEAVGGRPDQFVVESWVGDPVHAVPEADPLSFSRSVLDFARRMGVGARP